MTHTPGPWKIIEDYGNYQSEINGGDRAIATVWTKQHAPHASNEFKESSVIPWPEGMDNATLIASAPDLLSEVERLKTLTAALEHELSFTRHKLADERQRVEDCQAVIKDQAEEAGELRAALEPLAGLDIHAFENIGDGRPVLKWGNQGLTLGDVRRAKRVLGRG